VKAGGRVGEGGPFVGEGVDDIDEGGVEGGFGGEAG
jgi:hypothetical protein